MPVGRDLTHNQSYAMYTPPSFEETDQTKLHDFIEQHSFATLVSHAGPEPIASHLPLLLDRETTSHGRLIGHMARANSQWQQAEGHRVLAIFAGPHAYISPAWYEAQNVVPTWNYVAVHVSGVLSVDRDRDLARETVRKYVDFYELGMERPWSIDDVDDGFLDGLLDAIVSFEIPITNIEGKWKLSQNHTAERRRKVIQSLQARKSEDARQIADLMAATLQ